MIFYVKMKYLRCKDRLVVGGQVIEPPATITYASVVLREKVRIDLTLDALNDLPEKVVNIQNDYITATVTEKIWKVLVHEFGEDYGKKSIVHPLYGLKSAVAAFRNHLGDCMHHLGLLPCTPDLDL